MTNTVSSVITNTNRETRTDTPQKEAVLRLSNKYAQYNFAIHVSTDFYDTLPSNSSINTEKIYMGDITPVTIYNRCKSNINDKKYSFVSTEALKTQLKEQGSATPEDFEE